MIEAFLDLIRERDAVPTAVQIAGRAGCSTRLVFERFADFIQLALAAFDHIIQQGLSIPAGDMVTRDRATRIAFQVKVRATNCEKWLPLWRVLMRAPPRAQRAFAAKIALVRQLTRARLELMYAPELATLAPAEREATLIALEALTDYEAWGRLRGDHGLSVERGCAIWERAIDRLLPPSP